MDLICKEWLIDRDSFEETLIVTFSLKYKEYQKNIRQGPKCSTTCVLIYSSSPS